MLIRIPYQRAGKCKWRTELAPKWNLEQFQAISIEDSVISIHAHVELAVMVLGI
jgi:hypothetical protein